MDTGNKEAQAEVIFPSGYGWQAAGSFAIFVSALTLWITVLVTPFSGPEPAGLVITWFAVWSSVYGAAAILTFTIGIVIEFGTAKGKSPDNLLRFKYLPKNLYFVLSGVALIVIWWRLYVRAGNDGSWAPGDTDPDYAQLRALSMVVSGVTLVLTTIAAYLCIANMTHYKYRSLFSRAAWGFNSPRRGSFPLHAPMLAGKAPIHRQTMQRRF